MSKSKDDTTDFEEEGFKDSTLTRFTNWSAKDLYQFPLGRMIKRQKFWTIFILNILMLVTSFAIVLVGMSCHADFTWNKVLENWGHSFDEKDIDIFSSKRLKATMKILQRESYLPCMIFLYIWITMIVTGIHFILLLFNRKRNWTKSFKLFMMYFTLGIMILSFSLVYISDIYDYQPRVYVEAVKELGYSLNLDLSGDKNLFEQTFEGYSAKLELQQAILQCIPNANSIDGPFDGPFFANNDYYELLQDDKRLDGICHPEGIKYAAAIFALIAGMVCLITPLIYYCTGPSPRSLMISEGRIIPVHIKGHSAHYSPTFPTAYRAVPTSSQAKEEEVTLL